MLKLYLIQAEFIDIGIPEDYFDFYKKLVKNDR